MNDLYQVKVGLLSINLIIFVGFFIVYNLNKLQNEYQNRSVWRE